MRRTIVGVVDILLVLAMVMTVLVAAQGFGVFGALLAFVGCALLAGGWSVLSLIYEEAGKANRLLQGQLDVLKSIREHVAPENKE